MKKLLILGAVGVTLFAGTVVGLLAVQGRLDHEGTQGIPLLSAFFPAPAAEPATPATGADGNAEHPETGGEAHGQPASQARHEGLGKESPLPYRQGKPLFQKDGAPASGGHGQQPAHGSEEHEADTKHATQETASSHAAPASESPGASSGTKPGVDPEWKARVDSVLGQGQYHPGRLWRFPQIDTGVGVDELNQILLRARQQQVDLDRDRAALQKQQAELEARERDVADRQDAVLEKLREVEQLRAKLQAEIDEFHNTVLLIRQDEAAGLQAVAKTLAAVEPKSAASVIKKWWETEEGQTRALKIWTVMDADAANAILGELDVELIRQVLEKRLKVAREQAKPKR